MIPTLNLLPNALPPDPADAKLAHIKSHPAEHRHDFLELVRCCTLHGVIDGRLLEAHQQYAGLGRNGGVACDVVDGPCSCGAWH
jgi:hypothetical protein